MIKIDQIVLKRLFGYTMQISCHVVLKGVNWAYNDKIRSNGLTMSHLGLNLNRGFPKVQLNWQIL